LLESIIGSARAWDALLAKRSGDASLVGQLEALPPTPLRAARLAQVYLVNGRIDYALQTLARVEATPLVEVMRRAIQVTRHEYADVLRHPPPEASPETTGCEVRARALHVWASALWGEHRLREAARFAQMATLEASACQMPHFAGVCELLRDDCQALQLEVTPAQRERELRASLAGTTGEERLEVLIDLVQLMYRQGRYDESMHLSQGIPQGRQGRFFQTVSRIANRADVNWANFDETLDFGRLHAVHGLLEVDADLVLSGPRPRDDAPLTRRHVAEWSLAFGWAFMRTANWLEAAAHLDAPFIHRTEWDLRLVRAAVWLEMLVAAPDFAFSRCNAPAMLEDAARLLREFIAPQSVLVRSLPRAAPLAVALLTAAPSGCEALDALAATELIVLDGRGLTVNGVTRTNAVALENLITGGSTTASSQAIRAARYRLKRLLERQRQPVVVNAARIAFTLECIAALNPAEDLEVWKTAIDTYRTRHALASPRLSSRLLPVPG
jgi:hypothetical protein